MGSELAIHTHWNTRGDSLGRALWPVISSAGSGASLEDMASLMALLHQAIQNVSICIFK